MYRALLCFALLAFCSCAPYGDLNAARTLPIRQEQQFIQQQQHHQPITVPKFQQQDETELVDTLGGGYSFFKKQPIVSRPLIQQKLAISEQQVPIVSLDDTSNQWSDYTKASAFKQLPVQAQVVSASNDLLVGGGYGQQQQQQPASRNVHIISAPAQVRTSVAAGYGNQQQDLGIQVSLAPKTLVSEKQGAYGSALAQDQLVSHNFVQQQPIVRNFDNSYGQQNLQTFAQEQQPVQVLKPLIRNLGNSYGQQETQRIVQQQPIARDFSGGYGQQNVQTFVQEQQPIQALKPLIRNLGNSYGQQETQTIVQQQPMARDFSSGYGQQETQRIVQQQPIARDFSSGYGQQNLQTFAQEQQPVQVLKPLIRNLGNSYGQQQQQDMSSVLTIKSDNAYGQRVEPTFNDFVSTGGYGQNTQQRLHTPSVNSVFTQQQQQPNIAPVQFNQPTFSAQHTEFSHQGAPMTSSRGISQPQMSVQSSGSGSFGGW